MMSRPEPSELLDRIALWPYGMPVRLMEQVLDLGASSIAAVSEALLDKCRPIAGTPADCIAAIEEYREAGCTHVMLELWGGRRHEQIRLFGEQVLPHARD